MIPRISGPCASRSTTAGWVPAAHLLGIITLILTAALSQTPVRVRAQEVDPAQAAAVSRTLAAQLAAGDDVPMLVVLHDQLPADAALAQAAVAASAERTARGAAIYAALTAHARAEQAELRAWLERQGIPYRPFYIVNMIRVTGDAQLAAALAQRPEVARLEADPAVREDLSLSSWMPLASSWLRENSTPSDTTALPWGLTNTQADQVWALGYTGQNIVVAGQDTGVEWDHPALQPRYRGWDSVSATADHLYNWYDAWGADGRPARCSADPQVPCDDNGHGTHTVGTMNGQAAGTAPQLGMAPDAEWIACRNMRNGFGTPSSYTACFEFFLAPYPQGGDPFTDGNPALAPHIVNNSWGCPGFEGCDETSLRQVVETVRAAGIFVIASAGNSGPSCSSVNTPIALHDATFTVGAYNQANTLASFSSRGPVTVDGSGRLKPDIAAPGVGVYSAYVNGGYASLQGTSMASPHTAGAAALLWSAAPALVGEIDLSEQVLVKSAIPTPVSTCTDDGIATSPNGLYGYGRLNALAAVQSALNPARAQIELRACSGAPAAGVDVLLTDITTDYVYSATTTSTGAAAIAPVYVRPSGDPFSVTIAARTDASLPDVYASRVVTLTPGLTQTLTVTPDSCPPDHSLSIARHGPDPIRPGRPVSFTFTITNTGAVPWNAYPLTFSYAPMYLTYAGAVPLPADVDTVAGLLQWRDAQAVAAAPTSGEIQAGASLSVTVGFLARNDTTALPESATTAQASTVALSAEESVRIFQPTSSLVHAGAATVRGPHVELSWQTTVEVFVDAFQVYGRAKDGTLTPLSAGPVPAQHVGEPRGAAYTFVDTTRPASPYTDYVLEIIGADGSRTQVELGRNPAFVRILLPIGGLGRGD